MEGTAAWVVVQGAPTPLDLDIEEGADMHIMWWQIVVIPLLVIVGGIGQHWIANRAAARKADVDHTQVLLTGYVQQVTDLAGRVAVLESETRRSNHRSDRYRRIAYRAVDRVDDQDAYFAMRDAARRQHDPDHTLTPWVPSPPPHLFDPEWTARRRAELESLGEESVASPIGQVGG